MKYRLDTDWHLSKEPKVPFGIAPPFLIPKIILFLLLAALALSLGWTLGAMIVFWAGTQEWNPVLYLLTTYLDLFKTGTGLTVAHIISGGVFLFFVGAPIGAYILYRDYKSGLFKPKENDDERT